MKPEVSPGDIGDQDLGVDAATWKRLAERVDLIVYLAALVNHVLDYDQLFGPNVVGNAELSSGWPSSPGSNRSPTCPLSWWR